MINSINNEYAQCSAVQLDNNNINAQFEKKSDTAQYGGSDYSNAVRVERGISLDKAKEIAAKDSSIDYFCYTKGMCMVLCSSKEHAQNDPLGLISYQTYGKDSGGVETGFSRVFRHGDVVFFNNTEGKMRLGEANGLSDTYIKR